MKKLLSVLVITATMLLISLAPTIEATKAEAASTSIKRNSKGEIIHTVKGTESVKDIAVKYGVSLVELLKKNNIKTKTLANGTQLVLPKTLSSQEKDLMARLVHAEAKGEPYVGKVAVANVVLNRVDSKKFPNNVSQVIKAKGQFSPVANGSIKKPASLESKKAVNEAIALQEEGIEATFFYNPRKTNDRWIKSLKVIKKIGNHNFSIL
ncbi:cell wall hydrolase [Bacillus massiliigorillae]|uniref:cell wall hydrolase n=1 Tax=Bacillus massiliigorillae TaxID=1243664 RepID=UPI000399FDA9|nr:cell wall hydrolase [Bacillus massiliigorillae]